MLLDVARIGSRLRKGVRPGLVLVKGRALEGTIVGDERMPAGHLVLVVEGDSVTRGDGDLGRFEAVVPDLDRGVTCRSPHWNC
jgi:hypothetical protein